MNNRQQEASSRSRKWIWIGAAIIAVPFAILAGQVDNWQRDLQTNVAETAEDATDTRLKPLRLQVKLEDAIRLVKEAAGNLPRWEDVGSSQANSLHFTRTSAVFRFIDDVEVRFQQNQETTEVNATSRSRVGKGDLGQNPRNIDELFREIRRLREQE